MHANPTEKTSLHSSNRGALQMLLPGLLFLLACQLPARAQQWHIGLTSERFNDVCMVSATTGWAVGFASGIASTSDGGVTWAFQNSGTTQVLNGVWASSSTDAWVVGNAGILLRWDGAAWTAYNSGTTSNLNAVWGANASNVWAVGDNGTIIKWNGSVWQTQTSGTTSILYGVRGSDASNVWAVGGSGTVRKYNGTAWSAQTSNTSNVLLDVWAGDSGNVWAVGSFATIIKWNGSAWAVQNATTSQDLKAISGIDISNVWAVGTSGAIVRWNGSGWQLQPPASSTSFYGVSARDASNVWAVGASGSIHKWNGSTWAAQLTGVTDQLNAIWGASANNIWAVGEAGTMLNWNGSSWTAQSTGGALYSVWGSDAGNLWAGGDAGGNNALVLKWTGSAWAAQTISAGSNSNIHAGWSPSSNNSWVAPGVSGTMYQWNGSSWATSNAQAVGSAYYAMWGSDATHLWAVASSGKISMHNGSVWSSQTSGTSSTLYGLWGTDSSHVWAVGAGGTIRKWDGTAWTAQTSGTTSDLRAVCGSDENHVWAVGDSGTIRKWDGSTWSAQTSGTTASLRGVWASDSGNVWAVGLGGTILTTADPVPATPNISLSQNGIAVAEGATVALGGLTVGSTGETRTFTLTNPSAITVTALAVTVDGVNSADFSVGALSSSTIAPGGSATFTVTYTASSTSTETAAVHIASNVPGSKNPFDLSLSGQILSTTISTTGDGMNDAAKFQLSALGFDWQKNQSALVTQYYAAASSASLFNQTQYDANRTTGRNDVINSPNTYSLYSLSQVQALNVGTPLLTRDVSTGKFKITIGVLKATDLVHWDPFPMSGEGTSITVNPQGKMEFQFNVLDNAAFFRLQSQ